MVLTSIKKQNLQNTRIQPTFKRQNIKAIITLNESAKKFAGILY